MKKVDLGYLDLEGKKSSRIYVNLTHLDTLSKQVNTERSIRHALQERLPIVLVINKV